jgi:hypothetical protein
MAAPPSPCERCRNPVDQEDLFCDTCGLAQTTAREDPAAAAPGREVVHTFHCTACGARVSYDEQVQQARCAFCGSVYLDEIASPPPVPQAEEVVPFAIDRAEATAAIRAWLGRGFWRPGDLAARARLTELRPVFLPYWCCDTTADVNWVADTNDTPAFADADWCPCGGAFQQTFTNLLVPASGGITPAELAAISPFDRSTVVPGGPEATRGAAVEEFAVGRQRARERLRQLVETLARDEAADRAPGSVRNVGVNLLVSGTVSRPTLLPVWIAAYRYRNRPYRVVQNGQTGALTGQAPTSWVKVGVALAIAVAAAVALVALVGAAG